MSAKRPLKCGLASLQHQPAYHVLRSKQLRVWYQVRQVGSSTIASRHCDQIRYAQTPCSRCQIDTPSLRGLADSMKSKGTLQPIVVQPSEEDTNSLRVSDDFGLRSWLSWIPFQPSSVPFGMTTSSELALIENIQRADLNPSSEPGPTRPFKIVTICPHDEIGRRMGEVRPTSV